MIRWLLGKLFGLGPGSRVKVLRDSGLRTTTRDGVELAADRFYAAGHPDAPVILVRSPYGRGRLFGIIAGLLVARGFQVVVQCVRGTMDSGGQLDPMRQEQADGLDTIAWIRSQPWFPGQLFTFGMSYLGNAQWALAGAAGGQVAGYGMAMTLSNFKDELLSFGGYTQGGTLGWTMLMQNMVDWAPGKKRRRPDPRALESVANHLPLGTLDQAAFGKSVPWWQDWVGHDNPDDPWWRPIDHRAAVPEVDSPIAMVAGWQDIFLPFQLEDFKARQSAGKPTWLTIGPWHHASPRGMLAGLRESLVLFSAVRDQVAPFADRQAVNLYLQGADRWCEFPCWPPQGGRPMQWYLRAGGRLSAEPPAEEEGSSQYLYDPADPTPDVHGPNAMANAKVREMSALEERADTVVFTSEPLFEDMDVIGELPLELAVRSSCEHTDFFACICDVDAKGKSLQIADGYLRLRPGQPAADSNGVRQITINCWPTAYRLKKGHRLRVIVASGAHPRYARNLGHGEPLATATAMQTASQQILHGRDGVSVLNFCVFQAG